MVYLIEAIGANRVKIGFAIDVHNRLPEIQCGCPFDCKIIGAIEGDRKTERALHVRYSHLRIRGEWYRKEDLILSEFTPLTHSPSYSPFLVVSENPIAQAKSVESFLVVPAKAVEPFSIKPIREH